MGQFEITPGALCAFLKVMGWTLFEDEWRKGKATLFFPANQPLDPSSVFQICAAAEGMRPEAIAVKFATCMLADVVDQDLKARLFSYAHLDANAWEAEREVRQRTILSAEEGG